MPVILLLAAAAVLGGVIAVAIGRGGAMASFQADYAPLELEHVTATDVALLQPPRWLWGYSTQVTEEALRVIAQAVSERDVEIERLRQQVAGLEAAAGGRTAGWPGAVAGAAVVPEAAGGSGEGGERYARGSGRPPPPVGSEVAAGESRPPPAAAGDGAEGYAGGEAGGQ